MPVRTSRSLRLARETTSPSWNSWKKFHPTIKRYWQEYPQGFSYLNFLAFPYLSLSLSFYIVQGLKHKLRISIQMIIFGSLLTSFEVSIIFWGAWVIFFKNWLEPYTKSLCQFPDTHAFCNWSLRSAMSTSTRTSTFCSRTPVDQLLLPERSASTDEHRKWLRRRSALTPSVVKSWCCNKLTNQIYKTLALENEKIQKIHSWSNWCFLFMFHTLCPFYQYVFWKKLFYWFFYCLTWTKNTFVARKRKYL